MTAFATLTVSVDGAGVGWLTLDRPEKLNPLGSDALAEIIEAAAWFDGQDARVVVVSGAGRAFSAGFDLREFGRDDVDPIASADLGRRMADAVEAMRAVTVAAIHGHCVGGGVVLASACDLRVAADDTQFSIPEVDLGIPLAWGGIPRLVREIGPAATRDLVLTCRAFGADEALRLGFVSRVVHRDELHREIDGIAKALAGKAWSVLRTTLAQVREASEALVSTASSANDADLLAAALTDPDARAAAMRYLSRRGG